MSVRWKSLGWSAFLAVIFLLKICLASQQGKFLVITDFHLDNQYNRHGNRSKMCHRQEMGENETPKSSGSDELGPYGERICDSPPALVEYMLDEARRQQPNPDFIVWTGDTAAHFDYNRTDLLKTMEEATDLIRKRFPNTLVVPVLGNHDYPPSNYFPDDPKELDLYANLFGIWKDWIGEQAKETFTRGGYYKFKSPVDHSNFLVLNTNLYYIINSAIPKFMHPEDPTGQFAFLEKELAELERNNEIVHIIAHIPPGGYEWDSYGTVWNPEMPKKYNKKLLDLFTKYAASIRWMLFGHLHSDTFRILKNLEGKPVQRLFLNPSVTPIFELNNPAFRIYEYNTTNFDIIDIKTFYVDLDKLNKKGAQQVHAELEYSMREAYGLDSLDAEAMNGLLERMHHDESLFKQYIGYNKVMYSLPNATKPDRTIHLCVISNLDLDKLEQCAFINAAFTNIQTAFFSMMTTILALFLTYSMHNY